MSKKCIGPSCGIVRDMGSYFRSDLHIISKFETELSAATSTRLERVSTITPYALLLAEKIFSSYVCMPMNLLSF